MEKNENLNELIAESKHYSRFGFHPFFHKDCLIKKDKL